MRDEQSEDRRASNRSERDTMADRLAAVRRDTRNRYYAYRESRTVVVFVHGIFSNSLDCWRNTESGAYWPEILYNDRQIVDVSIFLAGYHTGLLVRDYGVSECARELLTGLRSREDGRRAPLDHDRIIFVCHSAGGVIVRHLLTTNSHDFASKRLLLALYASPSRGSLYSRWLTPIFFALRQRLGRELSVGHPLLRDLDLRFRDLRVALAEAAKKHRGPHPPVDLHGFEAHEIQPPRPISWLSGDTSIVTKQSATSYFAVRAIPTTDHSSIVKPRDGNALSHQYLKEEIERLGALPVLASPDADDEPIALGDEPRWHHAATGMLGAAWLRQILARERSPQYLAVDEGLLLWSRNDYATVSPDELAVEMHDLPGYPTSMHAPSPAEVAEVLKRHQHLPDVHEWLIRQIDASRLTAADTRDDVTKAGLVALLPPTRAIGEARSLLVVEPVSFWLIRWFNRRILDSASRPLTALRDQCLASLLSRREALHVAFPAALYVELVVTVDDGSVAVLRKSDTLSPAARSGRRYTSGVEEGLTWADIRSHGADFARIALLGLKRELNVLEAETDRLEFFGVGLEASHLNVGVLGHAHLRIGRSELLTKIQASDDYDRWISFVDRDRMDERIADRSPRGRWHPTARLRMLLLEYRRRGQDAVDAAIRRCIESPSPT